MADSPEFRPPSGPGPVPAPEPRPARRGRRTPPPFQPSPDPVFLRWLDDEETAAAVRLRGWTPDALVGYRLAWFTSTDWTVVPDDAGPAVCTHQSCSPPRAAVAWQGQFRRDPGRRSQPRPRLYCEVHMAGNRIETRPSDGARVVVHVRAVSRRTAAEGAE